MKMNPNDPTAKFNDIVYSPLKGEEVSNQELSLIKSLKSIPAKILDIACGTGRHLIPLSQRGYDIIGIDSSKRMLDVLIAKFKKAKIIYADILDYKFGNEKFDLIILMWNAFNEVALTKSDAIKLLKKIRTILAEGGKVLINIDDPKTFDPRKLKFSYDPEYKGKKYCSRWEVIKYFKSTNTTISKEEIQVFGKGEKRLEHAETLIKQRWWDYKQISELAEKNDFRVGLRKVKCNEEFYIILDKVS